MTVIVPALIIGVASSIALLGLLITVIASIHASEHRMRFGCQPVTRPEAITRRLLGAYSEVPGKSAALAARTRKSAR